MLWTVVQSVTHITEITFVIPFNNRTWTKLPKLINFIVQISIRISESVTEKRFELDYCFCRWYIFYRNEFLSVAPLTSCVKIKILQETLKIVQKERLN